MFIYTLDEKLPKSDNVPQETHENEYSIQVEQPYINKNIPRAFNFNIGLIMDGLLRDPLFQC